MFRKKIIISGGSIAGCTSAILLGRLGLNIKILERSAGRIKSGTGITLPESIINDCIANDLLDPDIPRLNINNRSFTRKDLKNEELKFWEQSIRVQALNWADVYKNLRKRINPEYFHTNTEINAVEEITNGWLVKTLSGQEYHADLIIAADGVDSGIRTCLHSNFSPEYAGYVAWRGVINDSSIVERNAFKEDVPYYVYSNGHILLYKIPSLNYKSTGETLLNWVMYEKIKSHSLKELMIDNQGKAHTRSLPAGLLTHKHIQYLHELSYKVLPKNISDIVIQTPQPFLQAVFDFQIPEYLSNKIIFVGDAASTLRPHTASGVFKALRNGLDLARLVEINSGKSASDIVSLWKEKQQLFLSEEVQKAKYMGDALVTNPPDWVSMNQQLMNQWWLGVMQNKSWYATNAADSSSLLDNSIFQSPNDSLFFSMKLEK